MGKCTLNNPVFLFSMWYFTKEMSLFVTGVYYNAWFDFELVRIEIISFSSA